MEKLEEFGLRYLNHSLPPWFDKVWLSQQALALFKTKERLPTEVRPIGMRNPLLKVLHSEGFKQNRAEYTKFLEPQQLGMSVAGGHQLVHSVRMLLEANPSFVCLKLDFKNAHTSISRRAVVDSFLEEPTLTHLAWHTACTLAPASILEHQGKPWGQQEEGEEQGDPKAGGDFNVAIQRDVVQLDTQLSVQGGMAKFGQDDGYAVGPPDLVFASVDEFARNVEQRCGLKLVPSKSELFSRDGTLPPNCLPGVALAGKLVEGQWENGIIVYGVPIGSDSFVKSKMKEKVEEVRRSSLRAVQVLGGEKQALWALLRQSFVQQLDWWLTLVYPSQMLEAAMEMDTILWNVLECCASSSIPRGHEGLGWECPMTAPVAAWLGRSYQDFKVRMPARMGGLGLSSMVDLIPAAFVGGVQQSLPHFVGERQLCPQLSCVLGAHLQPANHMWQPLLESGCRTGQEFAECWRKLQQTGQEACRYLDRELQGALSATAQGAGEGGDDGSIRRRVVDQTQNLQKAVMEKFLKEYPNPSARPVLHFPQLDKVSSAWVAALPGPSSHIPSPAFAETMCSYLCVPSPACRELLGQQIGGQVVDLWGDKVQSINLPGDHFRTKHDSIKMKLYNLALECRVPVTCEVFGCFSPLIPQQGLARIERGRQRQSMVPDFKFNLTTPLGQTESLAELKTIAFCQTYHHPGAAKRGVELRADALPGEYLRKARDTDRTYCGTADGEQGPVERRLLGFPPLIKLVMGPFADCSEDLHELLNSLAESKTKYQCRMKGEVESEWKVASNLTYLRRQMSVCGVRSVADSLLCRLQQAGPAGRGAAAAARRRAEAFGREERGRRERAAHWLLHTRGYRVLQRGQFLQS